MRLCIPEFNLRLITAQYMLVLLFLFQASSHPVTPNEVYLVATQLSIFSTISVILLGYCATKCIKKFYLKIGKLQKLY